MLADVHTETRQKMAQPLHSHRPGSWLTNDRRIHHEFLRHVTDHIDRHPHAKLTPAIQEFKQLIEDDPRIFMYFTQMYQEIPMKKPYLRDPTGTKQIRDYQHMLLALNHIVTRAPEWTNAAERVGMVGVPMCAIFDYAMGTPSGHAAFLDPDVNKALKKILIEWGQFLQSPESAEVLDVHTQGWFGRSGIVELMQVANAPYRSSMKFEDMFVCDPSAKHHGFRSWDDFFTRKVHDAARPVASPDDNSIVANACESKAYNIERDAKLRDHFFAKGQPYSILDMLAHDPLAQHFAGATVYQAFLSALSYHRWHAPVSGTVRRAFVQDGTFFSEPLFEGVGEPGTSEINTQGISVAQGYLSALAARAIIFIDADNPAIGLLAFIGIGMDEVSSCDITVSPGQHVRKGDEMGMFHFGGSSHCLLFRKEVQITGFPELGRSDNVPVRGKLAVVGS